MTRLERRIAEVADAVGRNVYVGRKGHKEDWFAGCDGIEWDGSSALAALESVVQSLREREESNALALAASRIKLDSLRNLDA